MKEPLWFREWVHVNVPKTEKISKDAVEILLRQLLQEYQRQQQIKEAKT